MVSVIAEIRTAYAAGDTSRTAHHARTVAALLGPHTQVEEQGLFPALADDFPDHVMALRAEHRRIDAVLDEASNGSPADPTWPQRLMDALDVLREHILKEQDGVFPAALATLRTTGWEAVDAVRARVGALVTRHVDVRPV